MAFEWTAQGDNFAKRLNISSMGPVGANSPGNVKVVTNNASVTFVDQLRMQATVADASSGNQVKVSNAGGDGANAYVLPWGADYASKTRLGAAQNLFFTPDLNGCAIFVSGPLAGPTIVHINSQTDFLDKGEPAFVSPGKLSMKESELAIQAFGKKLNDFKLQHKNPMWDAVYTALAVKMVGLGLMPSDSLKMLLPTNYLAADVGSAAVFGVRSGGAWAIYYNVKTTTKRLWP